MQYSVDATYTFEKNVNPEQPVADLDLFNKSCGIRPLTTRPKIGFQDHLSLNAGQKYCKMLQGEHSAIHSAFIKLPFVIKVFVMSFFFSGRFTHVLLYCFLKRLYLDSAAQ